MNKYFKKKAMAMGMAAVMAVTSSAIVDATKADAAVTKLTKAKATVTKTMKVGVGYKQKIAVTNVPAKTKVTYVSKNKKIATVTKKGYVKGKKVGKAVINVKLTYKKKTIIKKCKVTVKKAVKSITLKKNTVSLNVGDTYKIEKTVAPAKAVQKVTYTSNKKAVAKVGSKGKVTAKKAGTAKITVKAQDGSNKKAVLTVKVTDATATQIPATEVPTPTVPSSTTPGATEVPTPTVPSSTTPGATQTPPVETQTPDEPFTPSTEVKTITAADVKDGKVSVTGEYDKLTIAANVGDGTVITLEDGVKINKLTMHGGAAYIVEAKNAAVADVEVIEGSAVASLSVKAFANDKIPTLRLSAKTVITAIVIFADVKIEGAAEKKIGSVNISKKVSVSIATSVEKLVVAEAAASSEVVVTGIVTEIVVEAANTALTVDKTAKVDNIVIAEKAESTKLTVDGNVAAVTCNASKAQIAGTGAITATQINGNDCTVANSVKTTVTVGSDVTGTVVAGKPVAAGGTATTDGTSTGGNTGGSTGGNTGGSTGGNTGGGTTVSSGPAVSADPSVSSGPAVSADPSTPTENPSSPATGYAIKVTAVTPASIEVEVVSGDAIAVTASSVTAGAIVTDSFRVEADSTEDVAVEKHEVIVVDDRKELKVYFVDGTVKTYELNIVTVTA